MRGTPITAYLPPEKDQGYSLGSLKQPNGKAPSVSPPMGEQEALDKKKPLVTPFGDEQFSSTRHM